MLSWPPSVRVFVSLQPTDMRRSFDGLAALTREIIRHDPLSGHLFVFFNRPRDRVKVLLWDRSGYGLWYKRLEEGVFKLPSSSPDRQSMELTATELALILEGLELSNAKRQRRFSLRQPVS
jgi:transposase